MKNSNLRQSIGIIGGMGPQASAKLLEVMISMCNRDYGAKNDEDFPEIILNSIPVPNFISNEDNISISLNILKKRVKSLEIFNPACFGIACNTAHLLLADLQNETKAPFVSIIKEVASEVYRSKINKIGLLATPTTIKSRLYQNSLKKNGVKVVVPSSVEQKIVEQIIRRVLTGKIRNVDKIKLRLVAENLRLKGAQGIILGCTELPLIFPKNFSASIFDSIEILAKALLKRFYENKNDMINLYD